MNAHDIRNHCGEIVDRKRPQPIPFVVEKRSLLSDYILRSEDFHVKFEIWHDHADDDPCIIAAARILGINYGYLTCPFCNEADFDAIGLKHHLEWNCDQYRKTPEPR